MKKVEGDFVNLRGRDFETMISSFVKPTEDNPGREKSLQSSVRSLQ